MMDIYSMKVARLKRLYYVPREETARFSMVNKVSHVTEDFYGDIITHDPHDYIIYIALNSLTTYI